MGPIFFAVSVSILVYVVAVTFIPREWLEGSSAYTKHMLDRLRQQSAEQQGRVLPEAAGARREDPTDNPLVRAFLLIPGMQSSVPSLQRAGLWRRLDLFVLTFLIIFLGMLVVFSTFGVLSIPLAVVATWFIGWWFVTGRIRRRKRAFMDQFADALDSIVRSVKAGYPLNSAIALVAENMEAPIGPEFKRVADETAYGWTLYESLNRLADRIDEADVRFFAVVLNVQQEAGGNLAEVLSNLSNVIRKRKQLRLKIKALSSEGRATSWILGSLPLFVFCVVYFIAPDHLRPMFETNLGHLLMIGIVGLVGMGMLIVRQMINIEI